MQKKILITGASRGIGHETAKTLLKNGHIVFITARSADKLSRLADEFPTTCTPIVADLSKDEDLDKISGVLQSGKHKLDVLINNAGSLINKPFADISRDDWQTQLDCNIIGPALLTGKLTQLLNEGAHIVNIGSMGGFMGSSKFPGLSAYSASKGALSILTECLAVELMSKNISVNCLCFGAVQTEMLENAFPGLQAPVSSTEMGNYLSEFALTGHKYFNGKILPVSLADPN